MHLILAGAGAFLSFLGFGLALVVARARRRLTGSAQASVWNGEEFVQPYELDPSYYDQNEDFWLGLGKAAFLAGDIDLDQLEDVQARVLGCKGDPAQLRWCWRELIDAGYKLDERYAAKKPSPYYQLAFARNEEHG